jgi:plastocyanin
MRRTLLSLAGAAALVITLAACGDSDDDDGRSAGGCTAPGSSFTVGALDELKLDAESYEADAGCVEITYENEGSIAHTLLIKEQTGFKLAVGDTDTGTIELEPGSYTLFCDIAGHEAAGMHAELTVS